MKMSDKLLLAFFLVSLGLFGVIHLALYAEYKRGDILSTKELHDEKFVKYRMPAPQYLSLTGALWVNIIPSDSFYIEFPKKETHPADGYFVNLKGAGKAKQERYRVSGDTLLISGDNELPIHRPYAEFPYRLVITEVNVYCRGLKEIRTRNGETCLKGAGETRTPVSTRLVAENSTLWIGEYYNTLPAGTPKETFDSLDIESRNSIILLNAPAVIRSMHVRLDDHSEINDQHAMIGRPQISYDSSSRVNLTGENLHKAQLNIH
jgi:hypothetical protein